MQVEVPYEGDGGDHKTTDGDNERPELLLIHLFDCLDHFSPSLSEYRLTSFRKSFLCFPGVSGSICIYLTCNVTHDPFLSNQILSPHRC